MKVAIKDTDKVADLTVLKSLLVSTPQVKYVESMASCYYFYPNATNGDVKPDVGSGYWHKDSSAILCYAVEDSYDFSANSSTEITDVTIVNRMINLYNDYVTEYEIEEDSDDSIKNKDFRAVNYKTELKSGIAYTPVFIIHDQGSLSGLLNKTEYYRGFVDSANKGVLVLVVEEQYTIDESDVTINNSAKPALERTKTWKHVKKDGTIDSVNTKVRSKKYDTRKKRHSEGIRRRNNIEEQLIDNVGLAGILSGVFTSEADAHTKLTNLQIDHSSAFSGWKNSGRGTLYDDIANDTTHTWLDSAVLDTPSTQAMCSWMIGMTFKNYIIDKIKGNVK